MSVNPMSHDEAASYARTCKASNPRLPHERVIVLYNTAIKKDVKYDGYILDLDTDDITMLILHRETKTFKKDYIPFRNTLSIRITSITTIDNIFKRALPNTFPKDLRRLIIAYYGDLGEIEETDESDSPDDVAEAQG